MSALAKAFDGDGGQGLQVIQRGAVGARGFEPRPHRPHSEDCGPFKPVQFLPGHRNGDGRAGAARTE